MNWLNDFIRPRIRSIVGEQKEVPDNLWTKCPSCEGMLFHRDLEESQNVCYHCNHHLRISVPARLKIMFDDGEYEAIALPDVAFDPLKFKDRKKYSDRLKESQAKTGLKDAMTIAKGTIGGQKVVIAAFNFSFMGGSMGSAVGESILKAAEEAVADNAAFITIPASGGARMQEGMLSLMQMPRSIIAVEMVKDAKLPYIVLLTDPTTGGVSASFAMVGDIHLAEPGSTIGFAGRRVIEETVRETLPDDFQTAEYLREHGIVDMVVDRKDLRATIGQLLGLLMDKERKAA
jgi:acetyl-CoA carboxylase carboxyl transferase subunit beta